MRNHNKGYDINTDVDSLYGKNQEESEGPDLMKVVWRWKALAIFGALLGAGLGYLYFRRQVPKYRSVAMVQVVYPETRSAGLENLDSEGIRGTSRLDESLIIKSARVVDLAIDMGRLKEQQIFADKTDREIRDWILSPMRLAVEPGGRDSTSALLNIEFVCEDPQLCEIVINSIIVGYESYLEEAYRSLGEDIVRVATQAQDSLRESYAELSEKHAEFRRTAPMIWLGDEARNQFAENSVEINNSINKIQIESQKLQATLQHISEARNLGRSPDAILLMLTSDTSLQDTMALGTATLFESNSPDAKPFSSMDRQRELLELQMKEEELLDNVGEEHPSVAAIRRKIQLLSRQITLLDETERQQHESGSLELSEMTSDEKVRLWTSSIAERLASLSKQESLLHRLASENEVRSKELQEYVTQNQLLNSEMSAIQQLLDGFNGTLNRLQILPETSRQTLETLTKADTGSYYGPFWAPFIMGGATAGFLMMVAIGFLIDFLDQSFRGPEDISRVLGYPILGHIPLMFFESRSKENAAIDPAICTIDGTMREANEAYRAVRTNLYFSDQDGSHRVVQVSSPSPGDGKSTLAANLAVSIAQSGRSVVLVDADMRRPRVSKLFGVQNAEGLGEVILGQTTLDKAIRETPVDGLSLLCSNRQMRNPSEIVSHQRFHDTIEELRERYDYVILDTPPVLAVADACAVAARADGVLLTFRLRRDSKPAASRTAKALNSVGARVLGVIVNGITGSDGYDYDYYGYSYGYHDEPEENLPPVDPNALKQPKLAKSKSLDKNRSRQAV